MDLEAAGDVMFARLGLMLATVGGPVHRGVDDAFGLVADVEQAPDFGECQADPASERRGFVASGVVGGTDDLLVGDGAEFSDVGIGCGPPFFA